MGHVAIACHVQARRLVIVNVNLQPAFRHDLIVDLHLQLDHSVIARRLDTRTYGRLAQFGSDLSHDLEPTQTIKNAT